MIFVQSTQAERVLDAVLDTSVPSNCIFAFDDADIDSIGSFASWRSLISDEEDAWVLFDGKEESKQAPAVLLSTSGTTGLPKVARMSHYAIVTQAVMAEWVAGEDESEVR